MKKRLLAILMVLSMALSILPMSAVAAPSDGGNGADEQSQIVDAGGTVYYDKEGKQVSDATGLGDEAVVKMTKTVEQADEENAFEVTLQVQTNQKVRALQSENPDAAVVLVLDTSGSMGYCKECGSNYHWGWAGHKFQSRLALAKEAANQFLEQFARLGDESGDSAHRWVQIISFDSDVSRKIDWVDVSTSRGLKEAKETVNRLSDGGGTNIEGGLMLARNNLRQLKRIHEDINYLYTILLTDGEPTYHVNRDKSDLTSITGSEGGGNETKKADVEDVGTVAQEIKEISTYSQLYSICFGSVSGWGGKQSVWDTKPFENWRDANPATTHNMTIGEWLEAFSTKAYDGGADGSELFENFDSIMHQIALATKAFRVKDTMGGHITYVDEIPVKDNGKEVNNSVHVEDNEFTWNILQSEPVDRLCEGNASSGTAILGYEFKYKVTLDNLTKNPFTETPVNEQATLTYAVQDENGEWQGGSDEEPLKGTFAQPCVKSHYGTLSFTKQNAGGDALQGAKFTLTCTDSGNWEKEVVSDQEGKVSLSNIPSGHTYTLTEIEAPEGYKVVDPITVTVSYGHVTTEQNGGNIALHESSLTDPAESCTLSGETALKVNKTLDGRDWQEGDHFTFTLTGQDGAPMPQDAEGGVATLTLTQGQRSASFGDITFEQEGTYTYKVQETGENGDGITVDTTVYTVTVKVSDENGTMVPTVTYNAGESVYDYARQGAMTFTNQFTPATIGGEGDQEAISVTKVLEGRGWKAGDTFSFTLRGADETTKTAIENGTVMLPNDLTIAYSGGSENTNLDNTNGALVVSGSKTGTFGEITFNAAGTYTFLVKESENLVQGITNSKAEYTVNVIVRSEEESGALEVSNVTTTQTKNDDGTAISQGDESAEIVFTNVVTDQPTDTKSVTTGTTGDPDGIDPNGKVAGVGDILTYTIQWVNDAVDEHGNAEVATVTVTDIIPDGTEYVEDSAKNAAYDGNTKTLTWRIENAEPNATGTVSFQVKVTEAAVENEGNTIKNQATVQVGGNHAKQTTTTETYVPEKSVTGYQPEGGDSTTTVPDNGLKVGDQLTYTISYKNTTNEAATVIIMDEVPEGTKFVGASNEGKYDEDSKTVTWTLSSVAAGETGAVTLTVAVTSNVADAVTNQAQVQIGENEPKITVNTNTESTEIDKGDTITITPVDVTLYIGGTSSYWEDTSGGTLPQENSGIPAPHFYITGSNLTDDEIAGLTFHGTGADGTQKEWKVEPYGGSGENQAVGENGQKIWNIVSTNENALDASCQYFSDENCTEQVTEDNIRDNQYTVLYAKISTTDQSGAGNQNLYAETASGGQYALAYGTGVLTVRPVTDDATEEGNYTFEATESDETTVEAAAGDNVAAEAATDDGETAGVVVPADTDYTVNGQENWSLVQDAVPSLLFDDVLSSYELGEEGNAETGHTMLEEAVSDNAAALGLDDMSGRQYESKYFDLVDSNDGNVWVEADQQVVVYWPYPAGITYETASDYEFDLFHFTGMHREYTQGEENVQTLVDQAAGNIITDKENAGDVTNATVALVVEEIKLTENGIQFIADQSSFGFSPFVLTWVEKDSDNGGGGGGGGGGNKPSLNTEDHYGYIVGYPVDYETGEPTDDQARKPVKPQGKITRAEVATIFFRMLTDESRNEYWSQSNDFTDVAADAWYNNAISTMANAGILDGYEDGSFHPNGYITRAEFATIAVRFFDLSYQGEDLFPDIDGHWAQDYINQAADAGIIEGYPDGTFGPQKQITRAEAVTMVNRTLDRHPDSDHFLEDMLVWPDNLDTEAWYYADIQEATNSHEYQMKKDAQGNEYEVWTKILPIRDWEALEKAWSDANASENPGDVAG